MTNAELLALLREAREALYDPDDAVTCVCTCCTLTRRIDAALAEADAPVEWTPLADGLALAAEVDGQLASVAPTVARGVWAWRVDPAAVRPVQRGRAATEAEAKAAAIRAARGLS